MRLNGVLLMLFVVMQVSATERVRVIHVVVALCDNVHQGIVPVPASLGNGDDPSANLYWGALYGVKTVFNNSSAWRRMNSEGPVVGTPILERCVYRHMDYPDIYLVVEAYRGRDIRQAVRDFFQLLAGAPVVYELGGRTVDQSGRELVVYVGHNGLMDFKLSALPEKPDGRRRDAMVLACKSQSYFSGSIVTLGGQPVLMTTGFMAPEAYVLAAALDGWTVGEDQNKIRLRAATAYHQYQKCGLNGARRLFGAATGGQ